MPPEQQGASQELGAGDSGQAVPAGDVAGAVVFNPAGTFPQCWPSPNEHWQHTQAQQHCCFSSHQYYIPGLLNLLFLVELEQGACIMKDLLTEVFISHQQGGRK